MPVAPYTRRTALFAVIAVIALMASCGSGASLKPVSTGPVKEYLLPDEQKRSLRTITDFWHENVYPECLRKFKLKMSCDGCGYIYMVVVITIDNKGQMAGYEKTSDNVCGRRATEELERCFMEYLEAITFPKNLRGAVIEVRLGTGLKC